MVAHTANGFQPVAVYAELRTPPSSSPQPCSSGRGGRRNGPYPDGVGGWAWRLKCSDPAGGDLCSIAEIGNLSRHAREKPPHSGYFLAPGENIGSEEAQLSPLLSALPDLGLFRDQK